VIISAPAIAASRDFMSLNTSDLDIHPTQLLMNYHLGHKNSSMMFFPLNQAININHSSKRKSIGQEPNARVEFSKKDKRSRYILNRSLDDLKKVGLLSSLARDTLPKVLPFACVFFRKSILPWCWIL
jgi:hypothetical protein